VPRPYKNDPTEGEQGFRWVTLDRLAKAIDPCTKRTRASSCPPDAVRSLSRCFKNF